MLEGVATRITAMINDLGRDVIARTYVNTGPSYDPARTPVDLTIKAAITRFMAKETDGTIIQSNDKRAHISAGSGLTKQTKIIDGSVEYEIRDIRTVGAGSEIFLYIAQLRDTANG